MNKQPIFSDKQDIFKTSIPLYESISEDLLHRIEAQMPEILIRYNNIENKESKNKPKIPPRPMAKHKKNEFSGTILTLDSICTFKKSQFPMICELQVGYYTCNEIEFEKGDKLVLAGLVTEHFALCELTSGIKLELKTQFYCASLVNKNPQFDSKSIYSLKNIAQFHPLPEKIVSTQEFTFESVKISVGDILDVVELVELPIEIETSEQKLKITTPSGEDVILPLTLSYMFDCHYEMPTLPLKWILSEMILPLRVSIINDDNNSIGEYCTLIQDVQREIVVGYVSYDNKSIDKLYELWPEASMELKMLDQPIQISSINELYAKAKKVVPIKNKEIALLKKSSSIELIFDKKNHHQNKLNENTTALKRSYTPDNLISNSSRTKRKLNIFHKHNKLNKIETKATKNEIISERDVSNEVANEALSPSQKDALEKQNLLDQINILNVKLEQYQNSVTDKINEIKRLRHVIMDLSKKTYIEVIADSENSESNNEYNVIRCSKELEIQKEEYLVEDEKKKETILNEVKSYSIGQVCEMLERLNLSRYKDQFMKEGVNGELFLEMTEDILTQDLGITSKLHCKKILVIISKVLENKSIENFFGTSS